MSNKRSCLMTKLELRIGYDAHTATIKWLRAKVLEMHERIEHTERALNNRLATKVTPRCH